MSKTAIFSLAISALLMLSILSASAEAKENSSIGATFQKIFNSVGMFFSSLFSKQITGAAVMEEGSNHTSSDDYTYPEGSPPRRLAHQKI